MSQYHWNRIPDVVMHHVRTQAKTQGITMREYLIELVRGDMADYIDPDPAIQYVSSVMDVLDKEAKKWSANHS